MTPAVKDYLDMLTELVVAPPAQRTDEKWQRVTAKRMTLSPAELEAAQGELRWQPEGGR